MKIKLINKIKYKHRGVVGFEYIIVLIIMSVTLFGTFNVLNNTLKIKGNELATFINYNGQYALGINVDEIKNKWISNRIKGWRGSNEVVIIRSGKYYFKELYHERAPEYVYAWENKNDDYAHEKFTDDDHLIMMEGKDGKYYYMLDPDYSTDISKFKHVQKYKLKDIIDE